MSSERIYVAGHRGLVGSAILRAMASHGYPAPIIRTREQLDLRDQVAVREFMRQEEPAAIVLAAAKVGGINANNTYRWDFIYENLLIETNVIGAAQECNVDRLVFLGSSSVYPRLAPQPISEDALLAGRLDPTNEPYAIAKIAGLKLIEAAAAQFGRRWVSLMPSNLYGPQDNYDVNNSHVIPAMMRKFHEAKMRGDPHASVKSLGSGRPLREFLHVDDLATAVLLMLENDSVGIRNVGSGEELSILELASLMAAVMGYEGRVEWDSSAPDGTPRKLLDSSRMRALGWTPSISLDEGLASTYDWFLSTRSYANR